MNKNLTISLIIPAYNEENYIESCLEYAIKNGDGIFSEIIVLNNASTDKTKEIAEKYPGVRVVTEHTKGLIHARQRGYLSSKGDILAFVDADTRMPKGWAKLVKKQFTSSEKTGFVSGPYSYYDLAWYSQIGNRLYWRILAHISYFIVGYIGVGGNFAIRRTVLDQMKGFDTTIAFYGEDTDIARRAHKFGNTLFIFKMLMPTSARRLKGQGYFNTAFKYVINFLSQAIFHKSITKKYQDFR